MEWHGEAAGGRATAVSTRVRAKTKSTGGKMEEREGRSVPCVLGRSLRLAQGLRPAPAGVVRGEEHESGRAWVESTLLNSEGENNTGWQPIRDRGDEGGRANVCCR